MPLRFSLFEVLVIIGITQGFVIAGLIWRNKKRSISKLLLSFVLVVFNLLCIKILVHTTGLWQTPTFRYIPLAFDLAVQPLLWLYITSLTQADFQLNRQHVFHFIPAALSLSYSLFIYVMAAQQPAFTDKDIVANRFYYNEVKQLEDYLSIISSIAYWIVGIRLIRRYRKWLFDTTSATNYPAFSWLRNITILMGGLIAILAIAILLDYGFDFGLNHFIHWQFFFVYLAALIYYMGFRGIQLPATPATFPWATHQENVPYSQEMDSPAVIAPESYLESVREEVKPLDVLADKEENVHSAIVHVLEKEELYLEPELNLQRLAEAISTSPAVVSAVINSRFQKSFRNLINDYRVNKVKQRLLEPGASQFSILGIAYECGFNSEASFYRIFKTTVGLSPKDYIKQNTSATSG